MSPSRSHFPDPHLSCSLVSSHSFLFFPPFASLRSGRDLVNMAKQRPNIIPIIEDARHPQKYRMLVPMVDVVFADVAQPDQVCTTCSIPLYSCITGKQGAGKGGRTIYLEREALC